MTTLSDKLERLAALLDAWPAEDGATLLRQVTHDLNGALFAVTLDMDALEEAIANLRHVVPHGATTAVDGLLAPVEAAWQSLDRAQRALAEYVRGVQAVASRDGLPR